MNNETKTRFLDDPATKVKSWLIHKEQKRMRYTLSQKYKDVLDPQVYWVVGTDTENEGLSSDPVERLAQRLSLSQIGVFLAQRIWSKRTWLVTPALLLVGLVFAYFLLNVAGTTTSETLIPLVFGLNLWFAALLCFSAALFGPLVAQFFLPKIPVLQDEIDSVKRTVSSCVVRDLAPGTPADLADRRRLMVTDANGNAVAGQVLATDLEYSAVRAEWLTTKAIVFMIGLVILSPVLTSSPLLAALNFVALLVWKNQAHWIPKADDAAPDKPEVSPVWFVLQWFIIPGLIYTSLTATWTQHLDAIAGLDAQIVKWIYVLGMFGFGLYLSFTAKSPLIIRGMMLDQAVRESGTELLIDKAGRTHFQHLELARLEQVKNATKDGSAFIHLGTTTGLLAQRRDPLAPTEAGLPFGLSVADLATHVGVLGASGTGKTSGVIRPLTTQWITGDLGGLLVLDGKGALPLEFVGTEGYNLISPMHGPFNPIDGMSPDAVADVLTDVSDDGKTEAFFRDSARLMLRMAAIMVEANAELPYTLHQIQAFCLSDHDTRTAWIAAIADKVNEDVRLSAAARYWLTEYPEMPEKTAGSIVGQIRTWLGNILLHQALGPWVNTTTNTFKLEDVLTGSKLGLLLPESQYGVGGVAISALCMRRIYDAVKLRGDNWGTLPGHHPVLVAADEVQNLLTRSDLETVPVARSLGLYLMFATQNIDGLYKRLEKDGAIQMLGNLASIIALPPRTEDSNSYVAKRCGTIWKANVQSFHGLPDAAADLGLYSNSGVDQNMQSVALHRHSRFGAPRLSYAIGLWHQAWTPKAQNMLGSMLIPKENSEQQRPTLQLDLSALVTGDELDTLLAVPGTALAIINRGRIQRRDVIHLYPQAPQALEVSV